MRTNDAHIEKLDRVFQALSDHTRRAMIEKLCRGEQRVTELAAPHKMSLNAVSKHIKVLERAQLVTRRKEGREHFLRVNPKQLEIAQNWIARQQAFWSSAFNAIHQHLKQEELQGER